MEAATDAARSFDAIILAGGRGSRLGGVDKASLELAGERLVDRVASAVREGGAARVIVAGPGEAGTRADAVVREDPPFGGPLAALAAALPEVDAPAFLLLSCDLQQPAAVVEQLRGNPEGASGDGVILVDEAGYRQWLAARYRTVAVRERLREAPAGENESLRSALGALELRELQSSPGSTADIDTFEHLARARAESRKAPK